MNLQEYVLKYGTKRLLAVAELCDIEPGYMKNLLYTMNTVEKAKREGKSKIPDVRLPHARKLVPKMIAVSLGELTREGLENPTTIARDDIRPRMKAGWDKDHILDIKDINSLIAKVATLEKKLALEKQKRIDAQEKHKALLKEKLNGFAKIDTDQA